MSEFLGGILSQSPLPQEIIVEPTEVEIKKKKKKQTNKEMGDELDGISYSVRNFFFSLSPAEGRGIKFCPCSSVCSSICLSHPSGVITKKSISGI